MKKKKFIDKKTGLVIGSSSALLLASATTVQAQSADIQKVEDDVTAVGGITGIAAGVVIGAMGVRLAIKQVNRIMVKG